MLEELKEVKEEEWYWQRWTTALKGGCFFFLELEHGESRAGFTWRILIDNGLGLEAGLSTKVDIRKAKVWGVVRRRLDCLVGWSLDKVRMMPPIVRLSLSSYHRRTTIRHFSFRTLVHHSSRRKFCISISKLCVYSPVVSS